jgi:hypothetical protein
MPPRIRATTIIMVVTGRRVAKTVGFMASYAGSIGRSPAIERSRLAIQESSAGKPVRESAARRRSCSHANGLPSSPTRQCP